MRPLRFIIFVIAGSVMPACGPSSGEIPAQIVVSTNLKVVNLPKVADLTRLKGDRVIFRAGTNVPWSDYEDSLSAHDTFELARSAFFKKAPTESTFLRLAWNGSFFQATDFDSLYMITAYYWFEQAWDFYTHVVKDASSATQTPVIVSVYSAFTSQGLVKVPTGFVDNSSYQPLEDMFKMFRVGDQEGLPFEMNAGVVAHEFQHRIFHHIVFQSKGKAGYSAWRESRAKRILRATDEGIADINAVGFSRNANFLCEASRDLDGTFAKTATYENLADSANYYLLGTLIAKTIWEAADRDVEVLRADFLPQINRSLAPFGDFVVENLNAYDVDTLWKEVLKTLSIEKQTKLCREIKIRFQSLYSRIPTCA